MRGWLGLAMAAALCSGAAAEASIAARSLFEDLTPLAGGCAAPLPSGGKPVTFAADLEEDQRAALSAGVFLALHDVTGSGAWPVSAIEAAPPCPVARFAADEVVWTVFAGEGPAPVRWFRSPGRQELIYLARGPSLADARAWSRTRQGLAGGQEPPAYYLAAVLENEHFVFAVYDGPPDIRRLVEDAAAAVELTVPPLAVLDTGGDAVSLFVRTASGVQAELFRPGRVTAGREATLYGPDGVFFSPADGGVILKDSGFVCADRYGVLARTQLTVLNTSDEALDLACSLHGDESLATVFVTRTPDARDDRRRFARLIRAAEAEAGVAKRLPGRVRNEQGAISAWVDRAGHLQAILFYRTGAHVVEIRVTSSPAEAAEAMEALGLLFQQMTAGD